jgi:hypothetical protein
MTTHTICCKVRIAIACLLLIVQLTNAQDFSIKQVELTGDQILIFYDLIDTTKNRLYAIHLYSSKDNYIAPLTKIQGDVTQGSVLAIEPGANKKITWNAKEELGADFEGSVKLEVRGRVFVPFVRLKGFEDFKSIKRGVPFPMTWSGGQTRNLITFDLYKGDTRVNWSKSVTNSGSSEFVITTDIRPGSNYRFRISDSKNKDDVVYSSEFTIKRKVPLLYKIIAIAVVGGVVYFVLPNEPPPPNEIPNALCPDGTNDCNN